MRDINVGSTAVVATLTLLCLSAQAQTPAQQSVSDDSGGVLGEVVVTAQKRSENLQDVPLSISALTAESLALQNVNDLAALGSSEPGLQIANNAQKTEVTVRGIGASSVVGAFEQPVAVHIDGYYQARPFGIASNFYDVNRVEVLKGPQGTLYGRNATGGAVNIIYNRPGADLSFDTRAEAIYIDSGHGTDSGWGYAVGGVLNAPLSDQVQTRLSVIRLDRDGYTTIVDENDNKTSGQDAQNIAARAAVNIDFTDSLSWYVTGNYFDANDRSGYIQVFGPSRPDVPLTGTLLGGRNCGKCRTSYSDYPIQTQQTTWEATSTLTYEFNDSLSLRSLTQYRDAEFYEATDFDGVDLDLGNILVPQDSRQISQEFQLAGDLGKLTFILGLYHFDEKVDIDTSADFTIFGPGQYVLLGGRIETEADAVFGEATYNFTDALSVVLGARYSKETKGGANGVVNNLPAFGPAFVNSFVGPLPDIDFDAFTPKLGINYRLHDDLLIYASYTEGFKSGGYNIGNQPSNTNGILADSFDPEEVKAYELGMKFDSAGGRLQLNLAAFFYEYTDLQLDAIVANSVVIQNSGEAEISGIEMNLVTAPTDDLRLSLGAAWMTPEFVGSEDTPIDPLYPEGGPQSLDGNSLPRAPELTMTLNGNYTFRLPSGATIVPSATAAYKSDQHFNVFNDSGIGQESYWLLKSSLAFTAADEKYTLALYGDNLTDELYYTGLFPGSLAYGYQLQGITGPGRILGLRADVRF